MKFIKAMIMCIGISVSANAGAPNFLDARQTTTITMSIPSGKSVVSVVAVGEKYATMLDCTFYDANGNVALKQEHALLCWGETPNLFRSTILSIKITNEANERVQYAVSVGSMKND